MRIFRVIMPVPDLDRAVDFYTTLLGRSGEQVSGNRYYIDADGVVLALVDVTAEGRASRDFRPNIEHVYFATTELEAAHGRARELDPATGPIEVQPWGERSFYLQDPWGNPLCLVAAGTEFTTGFVR